MSVAVQKVAFTLGKLDFAWRMAGPDIRKILYHHFLIEESASACGHAGYASHPDDIEARLLGLVPGLDELDSPAVTANNRGALPEAYVTARQRRDWSQRPPREQDLHALADALTDCAFRRGIMTQAMAATGYDSAKWQSLVTMAKSGPSLDQVVNDWVKACPDYNHPVAELIWMTALPFLVELAGFGPAAALPFASCFANVAFLEAEVTTRDGKPTRADIALLGLSQAAELALQRLNRCDALYEKHKSLSTGHKDAKRNELMIAILCRRRVSMASLEEETGISKRMVHYYFKQFKETGLIELESTAQGGLGFLFRVKGPYRK